MVPSQTGVTFAVDTGTDDSTTLGGDMSEHIATYFVTSGTSSAAPTASGTGAASGPGDRLEAAFIRLRVTAAAPASLLIPSREPRLHLPNRDFDPWSVKGWR